MSIRHIGIIMAGLAFVWLMPSPVQAQNLPGGSWQRSCTNGRIHGEALGAICQNSTGGKVWTTARLMGCRGFGNRNGQLFCESPAGGSAGYWQGSFRTSCRDVSVDRRNDLVATCQAANGGWRRSNLAARHCPSLRAGNRNGALFCETSGGGGGTVVNWLGSFRTSCRNIAIDRSGTLSASCKRSNEKWRNTALAVRDCPSQRAGNRNGHLFCETGGDSYRWHGSYRTSCRDASVDGNGILSASCQAANGAWRRSLIAPRFCPSLKAGNRNGMLYCEG